MKVMHASFKLPPDMFDPVKLQKTKSDPNSWYKTHPNDPTPKSTAHAMLEEGAQSVAKEHFILKELNFQTYPMDDQRFDLLTHPTQMRSSMTTTYNRDYKRPYGFVPKPFKNPHDKPAPDKLFNRLPVNQFGLYPYATTKFMDDHMFDISEERRKVNFFRQIRNAHYPLGCSEPNASY